VLAILVPSEDPDEKKRKKYDEKTGRVISSYLGRWITLVPLVIVGLLGGLMFQIPIDTPDQAGFKLAMAWGLGLFGVLWFGLVWVLPVYQFKKYRRVGRIAVIPGRDINRLVGNFQDMVARRNREQAAIDDEALRKTLLAVAKLDLSIASEQHLRDMHFGALMAAIQTPMKPKLPDKS
jgi:hypothetical protein